ncbi:MAG: Clp protease N-terminal domain-containing protein [Acidimicrobiales bacterium]
MQPKNPQRTPGAEDVWTTAAALAAGGPVGTHHVLEALARSEGTLAANALGELGVDPDALAAKLEELGVEGTRDDTPEQSALRGMEVRLEADGLHVILSDADTLEKARAVLEEVGGDRLAGRDPVAAPLVGIWQATQRTLDGMRIRVEAGEETSGEGGSVSSAVRRAIEAQLRRLRARRPGQGEPPPTEGSG